MDASELGRMREDIEALTLPDVLYRLTETRTSDGSGGFTKSMGTASLGEPCRLDGLSNRTSGLLAAAERPYNSFILSVADSASFSFGDMFLQGSDHYKVIAILGGSWSAVGRYIVEKL